MNQKEIRWKERYQNLQRAFAQLQKGLAITEPNDVDAAFPRDIVKQAFRHELIGDGELWLNMLENRNRMAHTYDESAANAALRLIRENYFDALQQVVSLLDQKKK